jgi:hypothetical protein
VSLKGRAKKAAAAAASVSLATSGLSSCNDNGAVDPLPPPLVCNSVNMGQSLSATVERDNLSLLVRVESAVPALWKSAAVQSPVNVTVDNVSVPQSGFGAVVVSLTLTDASVMNASFTFTAVLGDLNDTNATCDVTRTFQITLDSGTISLQQVRPLPLAARQNARIVMLGRADRVVELEAQTAFRGRTTVAWQATGGEIVKTSETRARWEVPAEPGIYQAEVVMDYGEDGVAFDALPVEVGE